jgi:O-antigen ligase
MNYVERAYPWLLLSPVILPVVMWGGLIYPYLVPKTLFFYAISLITIGVFGLLVAHGRAFYWARLTRPLTWIPVALLALAYVASMYGIDFYRSFWSLFIRGDGLLMLTCATASFYLIVLYADRTFFERLLRAAAVVASFVAVYGIGEWLITGGRIGSLLGNAAFFAGYLGIAFFATLASAQSLSLSWRRAVYAGAVLQITAIILTATRGTIVALTVAGITTLAYFAFVGKGKQRAWSAGMLVTLIVLGGLLFAFRAELSKVSFEPIARIASISLSDGTVSSRLFIWKNMVTEIQKSPWLGVGTEHIDSLFNRFYDPTQIYEQWFDRSHNAFLDYAAQYGIGGLLLYLALIASFIIPARRLEARGESRVAGIFVLLATVYAIQNFFVFDTISSFWLLLALLAALIAISRNETRPEIFPVAPWARGASWIFALLLLYAIVSVSIRPALAAYNLAHAYTYQLIDVPTQINYLSRGLAQGTYGDLEYGYQIYDMYANQQAASLSDAARADAYQTAVNILSANFNRYHYDGRTALALAHVLSLAPQSIPVDQNLLSAALTRAIEQSPKRSQPWYILANLSIRNANAYPPRSKEHAAGYAAARDILTSYITLVPTLAAPHFVLAQLLYASGNTAGAEKEALKGKINYTSDLETARRAAVYYETILDLPSAAYFLAEVLRLDPSDEGARSDLEKIQVYEQSKK